MAPIEKGLGNIDSVFHKYPRYLNWNKNRISEVIGIFSLRSTSLLIFQRILNEITSSRPPAAEDFSLYRPGNMSLGSECGISDQPPSLRITGGEETQPNIYPWMVALIFK